MPGLPDAPAGDAASADTSTDAFHHGRFHLVQPRQGGHRSGMDALVLAACVPSPFAGHAVDFGAGSGAVGMAVAARCPAASVLLVETSAEMARYARATLALPANASLAPRLSLLEADVSLAGEAREAAGLLRNSADLILMNPPFNDARDRATLSDLKREAHVMEAGLFEAWLRSAASIARPGASVAIIARPESLQPILAALDGRFGGPELIAIHPRATSPAIRVVIRAKQGARGRLSILPPLILHEDHGQAFTVRAEAINAGEASLFGD